MPRRLPLVALVFVVPFAAASVAPGQPSSTRTTPPPTYLYAHIDTGPPPFTNHTALFTFSSRADPPDRRHRGPRSGFDCQVRRDKEHPSPDAWSECSSPTEWELPSDGPARFWVRAWYGNYGSHDSAGGMDFHDWTLDTRPPVATIVGEPADGSAAASDRAAFTLSADEEGVNLGCSLDGATPTRCGPDVLYEGLAEGTYVLEVVAHDRAANASAPARRTWTVDRAPPEPPQLLSPAGDALLGRGSAVLRWAPGRDATSGIVRWELVVDGTTVGGLSGCADACEGRLHLPAGRHRWRVRAQDRAGHVSDSEERSFVVDPDRPVIASARLARAGTGGYVLRTRARDALSGVVAMQVAGDRRRPGAERPFRARLSVPNRRVWVRVLDRAGNASAWARAVAPRRR